MRSRAVSGRATRRGLPRARKPDGAHDTASSCLKHGAARVRGPIPSSAYVYPKTGRTHQLRVHFADTGHPIIGDKVYGVFKKSPITIDRLALHAYSIELELVPKKMIKIIAPYPADFDQAVKFFDLA